MKVVVDTNVLLVSFGRRSQYRWLWDMVLSGDLALIISNDIILEYEEILDQKTQPGIGGRIADIILNLENSELVDPQIQYNLIHADPDDNKFVDAAITGNVIYIVSNDGHFNELENANPHVEVRTIQEFAAEMGH